MMDGIEQALDLAVIVMRNGGSTAMANRAFQNALRGSGLDGISAMWRIDFVGAYGTVGGQPLAVVRPIGSIGINLTRASEAVVVGERVARGEISSAALAAEIQRIRALPPTYGRWTLVFAAGFAAAMFSRLPGGDWGACGIAFVAGGVGQILRSVLQGRNLPVLPVTLMCGMMSACIAGLGLRLGWSQTAAATTIASVIYMVPGLPLINGFIDLVSHEHLLVGCDRIVHASILFLVLVIAIAFAQAVMM